MNGKPRFIRWLEVVCLGCALGFLLSLVTVWLQHNPKIRQLLGTRSLGPNDSLVVSRDAVRSDLIRVVNGQLVAFQRHDFPQAYRYASDDFRRQISLPAFVHLVRTGFPTIVHSRTAEFGLTLDNGQFAVVYATVTGHSGATVCYEYLLDQEPDGWRICAVFRVPRQGQLI